MLISDNNLLKSKGFTMSAKPQYTQRLVKDLTFQRRYNLTSTQTDIMAYLISLKFWATNMGNGFFLLLHSKVQKDLCLGKKTEEAAFAHLKKLGLIETTLVKCTQWKSDQNFRAVKITKTGNQYNNSTPYFNRETQKLKDKIAELEKMLETKSEIPPKIEKVEEIKPKIVPIPKIVHLKPLIGAKIFKKENEKIYRISRISAVRGGVKISLEDSETKLTYPISNNGSQILDLDYATNLIFKQRKLYQDDFYLKEFQKNLPFLGFYLYLKGKKYIIQKINQEKSYRVSINLAVDENADIMERGTENLKIGFDISHIRNFLEKNTLTPKGEIPEFN